jgi:hypothetical protein
MFFIFEYQMSPAYHLDIAGVSHEYHQGINLKWMELPRINEGGDTLPMLRPPSLVEDFSMGISKVVTM